MKLVVGVMRDLFYIIPVGCNTMLDGALEGQDAVLGLGFVAVSKVSGRATRWIQIRTRHWHPYRACLP